MQLLQNVAVVIFGLLTIGTGMYSAGKRPHHIILLPKLGAVCGFLLVCFRTLRIQKEFWPEASEYPFAIGATIVCLITAITCYALGASSLRNRVIT